MAILAGIALGIYALRGLYLNLTQGAAGHMFGEKGGDVVASCEGSSVHDTGMVSTRVTVSRATFQNIST